jgi:arsenite methyltransferase
MDVRDIVREKYGKLAQMALENRHGSCCGEGSCAEDAITGNLYDAAEAAEVPEAALLASLGCGNPTALASLEPGEVVLDLGSGGGVDVLLSAKRVGPTGYAYGLDMTDEMLALAEKNKAEAGTTNVKFLKGHIEDIPLPDASVDVIISNCVINLSSDKGQVLREAFRVLGPGGRFAVSDIVVDGKLPEEVRSDMEAYVGCIAGALSIDDYTVLLVAAGFTDITIEPTRRYDAVDLGQSCCTGGFDAKVLSAFIRAKKPM